MGNALEFILFCHCEDPAVAGDEATERSDIFHSREISVACCRSLDVRTYSQPSNRWALPSVYISVGSGLI